MRAYAYINSISCAVPAHEGHSKAIDFFLRVISSADEKGKLKAVARRLGIERRHTVLRDFFDVDGADKKAFYQVDRFPTTAERMNRYQKDALPLALKAVQPLLNSQDGRSLTHLIVTSCTGFYAPGLDIDIVENLKLNPRIQRTLIGYMGCYAAIPGLKLAQQIVQSDRKARVLMINVELCTLHWRKGDIPFDQFISFLLFADGCAASVISAESKGLRLDQFYGTVLPDTQDLMEWTIGDDGFFMKLDAGLPKVLVRGLKQEKENILWKKSPQDFDFWAIHPGGRGILNGIQASLNLTDEAMAPSREVLRNYGNMSSPTLMFILKEFLEGKKSGLGCALAFGPGLVIESLVFFRK